MPFLSGSHARPKTAERLKKFFGEHDILLHGLSEKDAEELAADTQTRGKAKISWVRPAGNTWYELDVAKAVNACASTNAIFLPQTLEQTGEKKANSPALLIISNEFLKKTEDFGQYEDIDFKHIVGYVTLTEAEKERVWKRERKELGEFENKFHLPKSNIDIQPTKRFIAALYAKAASFLKKPRHDPENGFHLNPNRAVYLTPKQ